MPNDCNKADSCAKQGWDAEPSPEHLSGNGHGVHADGDLPDAVRRAEHHTMHPRGALGGALAAVAQSLNCSAARAMLHRRLIGGIEPRLIVPA